MTTSYKAYSNVFGYGLQELQTLTSQLKAKDQQMVFYNAGVPGFDVNNYYFQYKTLAKKFRVFKRIIMFNIGNDFSTSILKTPYFIMLPYLEVDTSGKITEVMTDHSIPGQVYGNQFIDSYASYDELLPQPLRYSWGRYYPRYLSKSKLVFMLTDKCLSMPYIKNIQLSANRMDIYYPAWQRLKMEHWPQPFKAYAEDFEKILGALKEQQEGTIICLFPMREQVIPREIERKVNELTKQGWKASDIDILALNKYLQQVCAKYGLTFVDTTPYFVGNVDTFFQGTDQHLSSKGIELVADVPLKNVGQ